MGALTLLYRLILRPLARHPGRALLILFAVALGDAAVVAIDLAGDAAAGSFHSSIETLAGKATFEVTAAGGVPEAVAGMLARAPFPIVVSPRMENHAMLVSSGRTVPLIGVDVVGEATRAEESSGLNRQTSGESLQHLNDANAIWVTRGLSERVGDRLDLLINDQTRTYVVRGLLPESGKMSGDAILMDIAAAQAATGRLGRVDRILIQTPSSGSFADWEQRLCGVLPEGVVLQAQGSETYANRRMLAAFRWNLRVLSYIALIVGAFLIYNTLSVSVVRRRPDIGTMRALGASRIDVLFAFLTEAVLFGTVGSILSLPLGRLLASGAVGMLSTTVNALYVSSRPGQMSISGSSVLLALAVGIGVAIASAIAPAREASLVPPTEAMARGKREYEVRVSRKRDALIGLTLALLGAGAAQFPEIGGKPLMGYAAALLFVGSAALLTPLVVHAAVSFTANAVRKLVGVEGLIASRSLDGSLRRTSVLVAALATAIAMMTSVGIMVGSFRQTVLNWMDNELPADLYLRPAGVVGSDQHPTIDPKTPQVLMHIPGVAGVSRFRAYEIEYQGLPATLAGAENDAQRSEQRLSFVSGRPAAEVLHELAAGDNAIVSEPFANKHHVKPGDTVRLPLGSKRVSFRVIGIFYDYGHEAGFVIVDWGRLQHYVPGSAPTNLAVYLSPGANLSNTKTAVEKALGGQDVLVLSNREIREQGIQVFDQTFAITYALEAISIVVAIGGVAGSLVSIVMDRKREFGVLRFLGASSRQIRKVILVEAGLIGILATAVGLVLGYVLSLILVYVINKQSFGWTIQFHWPVAVLLGSTMLVYVATIVAGLYPARLAVRLNPIEVVHEE